MNTLATVQSFLYNRQALNRSPETLKWYEHHLIRFAAQCPELPVEPEPIEAFLACVVPNEQDELRHGYYRTLKAFYRFLRKRKRLPNPIEFIDAPTRHKKIKQTLKAGQMFNLLNLAHSLRDNALLSVFIDTGARASEIAPLLKANVHEDTIQVDGKTGQREVPISDETRRLLLALMATDGKSEYVFLNEKRGRPLTRYGIYHIISGYMRQAGIDGPKVGSHRLRHGFGKNYLVNGGDLRSLQKIMGHASIKTTEGYTELAIDELVAMHHKFTPLRSAYGAAQGSFLDATRAIREAETIVSVKG